MRNRSVWILIGGAAAAVIALAFGVPLTTVLLICVALACPAAMYFGMSSGSKKEKHTDQSDLPAERRERNAGPRKTA